MSDARSNSCAIIGHNRPFKVAVCAVTLVAFLFNVVSYDLAWAARTPSELTSVSPDRAVGPGALKELNTATFTLPQHLGTIKDSWFSKNTRTVIHIQDAHCNYYAQKKISEIIKYLNDKYGVNTVNLEGGAKDYDISIFTDIKDKAKREKAADYFVKEGVVNGAEYFAINNPEKVNLWGIEDVGLYVNNLKTYRNSLKYKDEVDKYFKNLSYILSNLKLKIYSKELLELDSRYNAYKVNNADFKDYLSYLIRKSKERLIDIKSYTNIYLLSQTLGQEGEIDFRKANNERDELIDKLQKRLSKNALEDLILKTVEFKAERMSQGDYYEYLAGRARSIGLKLDDYPQLQRYIIYISTYQATDKAKIMDEVTNLENKLKASLFTNDKDRELDILSKNLALMKNMFNISLTRDDYNYYQKNKSSFNISNYAKFIEREAPLYKIQAKLDDNIARLDDYREDMCKFYEYSFQRDRAFLKNINLKKTSIIVTGGFHTENLCDMFKKQGISYVSITPNFKNCDGYDCPYFKILSGEKNLWIRDAMPTVLNRSLATLAQMSPEMVNGARDVGLLPARGDTAAPIVADVKTTSKVLVEPLPLLSQKQTPSTVIDRIKIFFGLKFNNIQEQIISESAKEAVDILLQNMSSERRADIAKELVEKTDVKSNRSIALRISSLLASFTYLILGVINLIEAALGVMPFDALPSILGLTFVITVSFNLVMFPIICFFMQDNSSFYFPPSDELSLNTKARMVFLVFGWRPGHTLLYPGRDYRLFKESAMHEYTHYLKYHKFIENDVLPPVASVMGALAILGSAHYPANIKEYREQFDYGVTLMGDTSQSITERYQNAEAEAKLKAKPWLNPDGIEPAYTYALGYILLGMAYALSLQTGNGSDIQRFIYLMAHGKTPA
ncbi:MAG: hypothetical protein PHV48_07755, partial [Candidatus Omnitrophica bacterium]|nr:hypothetical protein [Candidatus Omnitrophota bacterium]